MLPGTQHCSFIFFNRQYTQCKQRTLDRFGHRQVVGVGDPADRVGVLAVTLGELGGTPARDRSADDLFRADESAETDQDDDGVLTVQPINVVIVHAILHLANRQRRLQYALHDADQLRPTQRVD